MPDLKEHIYGLSHDEVVARLVKRKIVGQHFGYWLTAAQAISGMEKHGYWCELKSPFAPGEDWFAGFTRHNATGWNSIPDNQMHGPNGPIAILRAALLTVMNADQEAESENQTSQ